MQESSLGPLKVFQFPTIGAPNARVAVLHGLGEHSGRHRNTIDFLTRKGFEVVTFDFRGAGQSQGERMWVEAFDDYVDDGRRVLRWIEETLPKLPLFLLGHSLGGSIALYIAAESGHSLRGIVLSAPGYLAGGSLSPFKIRIAKLLAHFTPHLVVRSAIDLRCLSRDTSVAEAYAKDRLCCSFNTVRQGNEILRAMARIPEICEKIHVPVLIVHGEADTLVLPEGSREILARLASDDKTLQILPACYHEPHNDIEREKYFDLVGRWLEGHCS